MPVVSLSEYLTLHCSILSQSHGHISPRYVKEAEGALVGDSQCERLPVEVCGAGCTFEEGSEDCHEKVEQGNIPQLDI